MNHTLYTHGFVHRVISTHLAEVIKMAKQNPETQKSDIKSDIKATQPRPSVFPQNPPPVIPPNTQSQKTGDQSHRPANPKR
jgi:hypothetical protein